MTPMPDSSKQKIAATLLALAALAVLWIHAAVLAPFVLSLVLAYALKPATDALVRHRIPRALAIALCILLALLMVLTLVVLLVPIVSQLAPMLRDQVPDLLSRMWSAVAPRLSHLGIELPSSVDELRALWGRWANGHAGQWAATLLSSLLIGGSGLMTALGFLVMVPMLAFYWLLDWDGIADRSWSVLPPRWRPSVRDVLMECDQVMGQYLRGQIIVMLVLAVYYSVGLALAGFHLALPIGVFTGLAVFIPYLGFGLGLALALLVGVLQFSQEANGLLYPMLAVALVYGLGQVLESFFLTPRLVGQRIGLHPIAVIFVLLLFGHWMGFVGVLIALPVSALLMVLGQRALRHYRQSKLYRGPAPGRPGADL